jgi:hypothetical protein
MALRSMISWTLNTMPASFPRIFRALPADFSSAFAVTILSTTAGL